MVCSETAGTRETVISGATGWIVPDSGEFAANFADRILDVLNHSGDQFGEAARLRAVTTFSKVAALEPYTNLYSELLEQSPDQS